MSTEEVNSELENILSQARTKFNELSDLYNKFDDLRTELQNKAQGVRNFHSNSQTKSGKVDSNLDHVNQVKTQIEQVKQAIDTKKQEVDTYYQQFDELRKKLDDESDGIEANFEWVKEKKEEANKKYEEVIKIHTNAENAKNEILEYEKQVKAIKEKSEEFKDSIGETLDLVSSSSLVNSFKERKVEIEKSVRFWKWFLIISLLVLAGVIIYIYKIQAEHNGFDDWKQWYRYLFATPIAYLVYISTKNYTLERDLLEKYSYKAVISTALRSYIKLFRDHFPTSEEELLDFTLESTERIYKEPYAEKDKKRKIIFGIKSIFNVGLEETEMTKIKEARQTKLEGDNNE